MEPIQEKKCKYCAMMIPTEAKICPHCRKQQGTSFAVKALAVFFVLFVIGIIVNSLSSNGPSGGSSSNAPTVPNKTPMVNNPATATGADSYSEEDRIYREFEVCMNESKKIIDENKLEGQRISSGCFMQLKKYDKKKAKRAFDMYFNLN
ncbi:MAG: hypothetical protein C0399_09555 [Syntrophus sp. (in: bacteria)]|nr:hypothetical protein [Syntrophus sp. (in: bacteria)]